MMTHNPARAKALLLLGILATTGGTLAASAQADTYKYINGQKQTGCELPAGVPCSTTWFLGNQGTIITPSARCSYNAAGQQDGEVITTTIVSAGPGHCCTNVDNSYVMPACDPGVPAD